MEMLKKICNGLASYLKEPLSGQDSSRRLLFFIVVIFCLGLSAGYVPRKGLDDNVLDLLKTLIYVTGGALAVGKFAEQESGHSKEN